MFLILAQGLAQRGWAVDLVVADAAGPLLPEVPSSVQLISLESSHVMTSVVPLAHYLRKRRPHAVLTAMSHANLIAIAAAAISRIDTHLVVTEHQHLSTLLAGPATRRDRMFPILMRVLYRRAAEVVAVSEGLADDLAQRAKLRRSSIRVEKNPIRIEELRALGAKPVQHAWFRASEPPVVLAVGRLTRQKDFGTLVRAFRQLRDTRRVRLMILGDGEDRTKLEGLVAELDLVCDVQIMGFVPNPYPYYAAASLFVLSSLWEGLPTVLLEAMVFGLPIVSTDCPSGPEEILDGGRLGTLVATNDPTALAHAMMAVLPAAGERTRLEYDNLGDYDVHRVVDRYSRLLSLDPPRSGVRSVRR
jgi:glycosyltransferase involved in cell wall biosynthesis